MVAFDPFGSFEPIEPPGPLPGWLLPGLVAGWGPSLPRSRPRWSRQLLLEAVKKAAEASEEPLSVNRFVQMTGISDATIYRLFRGGWGEVQALAGIPAARRGRRQHSDEELLRDFHRVVGELGRIPTWSEVDRLGRVSSPTLQRRFGGKRDLVRRYREFVSESGGEGL